MSKKFLLGLVVVLLITNITTFLLWSNDRSTGFNDDNMGNPTIHNKKVIASVENKDILYSDWMAALQDNYGEKKLKEMIDREVVMQLANKKNIVVNDKIIDREMSLLITTHGILNMEEMKKLETRLREDITYRYQLQSLLAENMDIPDEEIQEYYNKYYKQYNFIETLQLSHIVVPDLETAEKVQKELDEGAKFSLLAREYSMDDETKSNGGYLGFLTKGSQFLPKGYYEVAKKMDEGTYSKPVVTDKGISIIYLHRHLPEIIFIFEEIKTYIEQELALEKLGQSLVADPLWEQLDISWEYEEK